MKHLLVCSLLVGFAATAIAESESKCFQADALQGKRSVTFKIEGNKATGVFSIESDGEDVRAYEFSGKRSRRRGDVKGAYDCFADHAGGEMWKRHGKDTFYPPGKVSLHKTGPYVRWKKEKGKWVIAEIAYSTA